MPRPRQVRSRFLIPLALLATLLAGRSAHATNARLEASSTWAENINCASGPADWRDAWRHEARATLGLTHEWFSEELRPRDLLTLLNRYLDRMSAEIERHGGVIDKFVGDAIMALFSALAAALAMERALAGLDRELAAEGRPPSPSASASTPSASSPVTSAPTAASTTPSSATA